MSANRRRAIVYGGSGFLGSHVAGALTDAGYDVVVFDVSPSRYLQKGQRMVVGDLMDPMAVLAAGEGCDYFYNFAGIADLDAARLDPLKTAQVNVVGNLHVLEAARKVNAKRFVFASTVYVFSESGSFYRASKQSCERFIEAYQEQYGLDFTILRYGSLYGRRSDRRNGVYRLLREALEKGTISYEGSPDTMREYIHVTDAARLSVMALEAAYANRHLLLTGPERMPIKALLKMISEMVEGEVKVTFSEEHPKEHYVVTPYSFTPRLGHKLIANDHVDIGQGLLDCLTEIYLQIRETHSKGPRGFDVSSLPYPKDLSS